MKKNLTYILIFITLNLTGFIQTANAQDVLQIEPLFEYPVAPEDIESLSERCDYVVTNFWEPFDFKNTQAVNQIALNHAFNVYLNALIYSSDKGFKDSLDKLIKKISGNPTLLVQFEKAAEESLYGPRAEWVADDIYMRFLDAAAKNKKISKTRREKYNTRANLIRTNTIGQTAPTFKFIDIQGKENTYFPMSTPTILIFGDPTNTDWRLARIRMDSNSRLTQAIDKGKLNIIYISLNQDEAWKNAVANYSKKWNVGVSDNIKEIYDLRLHPSIYLIGNDGNILLKNSTLDSAIDKALEIVGE
ncbi:MAG: DUF5106 domain-containing protein [Muribaculaceae bacterium]|nr:DUF5106 domain-containing protein [Muribaculaceae bacterium]